MNASIARRIAPGVVVAWVALLAIGIVSRRNRVEPSTDSRSVEPTREVMQTADTVFAALMRPDDSVRGGALTADPTL
jgi:hypothetical protein